MVLVKGMRSKALNGFSQSTGKKIEAKELLPEYKPDLGGRLSGEQCP